MSSADFDTLTDWIGIPLTAVAVLLFVAADLPTIAGRALPSWTRPLRWILAAVIVGIIIARFIRLA